MLRASLALVRAAYRQRGTKSFADAAALAVSRTDVSDSRRRSYVSPVLGSPEQIAQPRVFCLTFGIQMRSATAFALVVPSTKTIAKLAR